MASVCVLSSQTWHVYKPPHNVRGICLVTPSFGADREDSSPSKVRQAPGFTSSNSHPATLAVRATYYIICPELTNSLALLLCVAYTLPYIPWKRVQQPGLWVHTPTSHKQFCIVRARKFLANEPSIPPPNVVYIVGSHQSTCIKLLLCHWIHCLSAVPLLWLM